MNDSHNIAEASEGQNTQPAHSDQLGTSSGQIDLLNLLERVGYNLPVANYDESTQNLLIVLTNIILDGQKKIKHNKQAITKLQAKLALAT